MMTPNDVENRMFSTVRFGGYNMEEVNRFLDELSNDYAALFQENAASKRKMKFLIGKINEFQNAETKRSDDTAHPTYASAKAAADKLLASARAERDAMLAEARAEADRIRFEAEESARQVEERVFAARQSVVDFTTGMRKLVELQTASLDRKADEFRSLFAQEQRLLEEQAQFLARLDEVKPASTAQETENAVESAVKEVPIPPVDFTLDEEEAQKVDEPTRIVDISEAEETDYRF